MADRNPAREPDPNAYVRRNERLINFLDWCQKQLAWLTMRPRDYDQYRRITLDFELLSMPYDEFRNAMGVLLQDPDYAHLRVYWDNFHRDFIGEVQLEDIPLYLFPYVLCSVLYATLYLALLELLRIRASTRTTAQIYEYLQGQSLTLPHIVSAIEMIGRHLDVEFQPRPRD